MRINSARLDRRKLERVPVTDDEGETAPELDRLENADLVSEVVGQSE